MNDYYINCKSENIGAKINDIFTGCIGYCDDNIIHSKLKSFITDYKKICTYLNVDNQYLINNINHIIINYKKKK